MTTMSRTRSRVAWLLFLPSLQHIVYHVYDRQQGVCVCSYGTDEFPAFFTRRSGCTAPARADDPDTAARMISAALQLDLDSGIVIGTAMMQLC